ncbi:hypothetical protein Pan153_49200 [Gimesia panareensis]|uniref:UPF0235 protein Pan153_49200 n=1 Tax=Gimesia panareensis TaxID=2527978 RepID=A0A518FVA0_9PLAN|nr:DUF167 domain-containing protein [Gimesia panareensis]QDV20246.1 hypothetical protein Pan153_49200 [Gimesia panareensis]
MTTSLNLESDGTAVLLPVRAQPKSSRNQIEGIHAGRLKVCVTQAPEKGKANKALLKVLQNGLQLKRSQIELYKGETAGLKVFRVTGMSPEELQKRIDAVLETSG